MPDWMDPYATQATNPYLQMPQQEAPDWRMVLANLATGIGTGISQGAASGQGWAAGLAPGIMMGNQLTGLQQQRSQENQLRQMMFGLQAAKFGDERAERERKLRMQQAAADEYLPGMRAPQPPLMGQGVTGPAPNRDEFVKTMMPHALEVSRQTGLDPRLVIAQAALETGFGKAAPGNNYFGIKSHGRAGGQVLPTNEVGPAGEQYTLNQSFRSYANPGESAKDYADFLKTNSRYQPVLGAQGLDAQIDAMGKSGYATDPQYGAKLRQIAQGIPGGQQVAQAGGTPVVPQGDAIAGQGDAPVQPVQYAQQPSPAPAAPASDGPPKLALPPKPELPAEDAVRIRRAILAGGMTPEQGRSEANRIVGDLWGAQKDEARARYQQESENYRFNRGQDAGEWQILDPKNAQMKLGPGYDNGKAYLINKKGEIKPVGGALVEVNTGDKLMPGQKKVDEKFADQYIEFVSGGGFADSTKMLNQLQEVQTALKSGAKLTGPVIGTMGDTLLSFANPDAMAMRDAVFEVAQRNLRLVLGAQFTAKEGEQLIARTYNPRLSEEENAKRVGRLMEQIKTAMEARVDSAKYFEEHGTLRGWRGKLPSMADFEPAKAPEQAPPPTAAPPPGAIKHLQMNPKLRDEFDAKYGPGAAAKALGK